MVLYGTIQESNPCLCLWQHVLQILPDENSRCKQFPISFVLTRLPLLQFDVTLTLFLKSVRVPLKTWPRCETLTVWNPSTRPGNITEGENWSVPKSDRGFCRTGTRSVEEIQFPLTGSLLVNSSVSMVIRGLYSLRNQNIPLDLPYVLIGEIIPRTKLVTRLEKDMRKLDLSIQKVKTKKTHK